MIAIAISLDYKIIAKKLSFNFLFYYKTLFIYYFVISIADHNDSI